MPAEQVRVERTFETQRHRPGHDHMPVFTPRDIEGPAVELYDRLALGEPAPMRCDESGTGAAAAGAGDPGPALPDPQPDVPGVTDRGDADIGPLGKQRVMFEDRPECREIDRVDIIDEEGRVRIADIGAGRCGE